MLKAAAGGGGKGMRLVHAPQELKSALEGARSEAERSFGDSEVYIEKAILNPRHIEMQVLADEHGNTVYLGERECSLQRRHQKVVEEAPSPIVDPDMRRRMGEIAVRVAQAAGYTNAGTVEFLVDQQKNFYFLEMNTRLQVEHPVTELVTGLDLVHLQIRIANGERLPFAQDDVTIRGHAIECRIYAEDPDNNYFPSPGKITLLLAPSGPGIRRDSGMYEGWTVPMDYDPLACQADRLRHGPRPGDRPPDARAERILRGRDQDEHFAVPPHPPRSRFPRRQTRYRIPRSHAEAKRRCASRFQDGSERHRSGGDRRRHVRRAGPSGRRSGRARRCRRLRPEQVAKSASNWKSAAYKESVG